MKKDTRRIIFNLVGVVLSFLILIPLLLIILTSFKNSEEANKVNLSLAEISFNQIKDNYVKVVETTNLQVGYFNSIVVTLFSVVVVVIISSMMAFVIQRRKDKITETINLLLISGMMLPASIVCQYFIIRKIGLTGNVFGASLIYIVGALSMAIFLYTGYFKSIPRDLDESALLDGCGPYRLFFQIILPLLRPATVTVTIITAMSIWNDFNVAIFLLNTPKTFTIVTTTFSFMGAHSSDWNLLFADIVLISLPVVILYLSLQKYIVSGMTAGAVKG